MRPHWFAVPAVVAMLASTPFAFAQPVASVTVSAGQSSILVDASTQLTATVRDNAGNVLSGRPVAWSVNDAALASVSPAGLLTGILPGSPVATATVEGVIGTATVTVRAPTLQRGAKWFTGHVGGAASDLYPERSQFGWGYSWYVAVHPLKPNREELTQLGWGTWMQANNVEDANNVLSPRPSSFGCPPSASPSYFYDANEGGVGSWGDIQFPTAMPKYTITRGISAIGGRARKKLSNGSMKVRTLRYQPRTNPTGTASAIPSVTPKNTRCVDMRMSTGSRALVSSSQNFAAT